MPSLQQSLASLVLAAGTGAIVAGLAATPARAEALLLVDADSGKVLEGENATYPWYPASVTKLMTAYVTFKAMRDRRVNPETLMTVSPNAVAQQPSKMGFKTGTQLTADNALKMLLVHSANDMAVVLAEGVSGSIEKFADEMNAAARRLGMTQTNYVNPNGLPADDQVTSARDLALLARALMREFPEYSDYWHIASIRMGKRVYRNTNRLIDAYPGTDGMKTGFICASGFNLVASATRGDKHLIAVVLGAPSSAARSLKAAQMLERGFSPNPFSWLLPSLGTVDSLVPVAAAPPNLRDDICGKNHPHPPAEDADGEGETAASSGDQGGQRAFMLSSLRGSPKGPLLTSGLAAAIPPVDVYVGPAHAPGTVTLTAGAPASGRKKADTAAAKPPLSSTAKPAPKHPKPSADAAPAAPAAPAAARAVPAASAAAHAAAAPVGLKPWPGDRTAPKTDQ